jgi:hypothetical protein
MLEYVRGEKMLDVKNVIMKVLDYLKRAWDTYVTYIQIDPDELEGFQFAYVLWGTLILIVLSLVFISFMLSLIKLSAYIIGLTVSAAAIFIIGYIIKNLLEREKS